MADVTVRHRAAASVATMVDESLFVTRVAPLLAADDLRALRAVGRLWQRLVDALLPFKAAFVDCATPRASSASALAPTDSTTTGKVVAVRFLLVYGLPLPAWLPRSSLIEWSLRSSLTDAVRIWERLRPDDSERTLWIDRTPLTDVVQWLCAPLSAGDIRRFNCFQRVCQAGHLQAAQFLAARFELTRQDALADNSAAFRRSCWYGHLDVARWLADHFHISRSEATALNNSALRYACWEGHLATVTWLVERFGLSTDDITAENNYALRYSCANGHDSVARWLVCRFQLQQHRQQLLRQCGDGGLDKAVWNVLAGLAR
jgi:hypothetical protein